MQGHNKKLYASFLAVVFLNGACNKVGEYGSSSSQGKNKNGKTSEVKKSKNLDDGKGVRLSLALPASFEESDSKEASIDQPQMDASFEKAFSSGYIQMACDDNGFGDEGLAEMKERKVRAIIELTLNQRSYHGSQTETEEAQGSDDASAPFPEKDPGVEEPAQSKEPPKEDKLALADETKKGEPVENQSKEKEGPAENFPADEEQPWIGSTDSGFSDGSSDGGGYGETTEGGYGYGSDSYGEGTSSGYSEWSEVYEVEHVMMPYTCEGKATIRVVNLEKGTEYSLDARLFTAEGTLAYAGATEGFVPEDGKQVDLVMAPVQNQQVDINVIFADAVSEDIKKGDDDDDAGMKDEGKLDDESKEGSKDEDKAATPDDAKK